MDLDSQNGISKPKDTLSDGEEKIHILIKKIWYFQLKGQKVGISHEKLQY